MCNVLTICACVYVSVKQNAIFHLMWTLTFCIVNPSPATYFWVKHRALLFLRLTVCMAPCWERPNTYSATVSKLWSGCGQRGAGRKLGLLTRDWVAVDTWHFVCLSDTAGPGHISMVQSQRQTRLSGPSKGVI